MMLSVNRMEVRNPVIVEYIPIAIPRNREVSGMPPAVLGGGMVQTASPLRHRAALDRNRNGQVIMSVIPAWDIGRAGRAWGTPEAMARYQLAPEKIEMVEGRLFWSNEARLTMLALLLENLGADARCGWAIRPCGRATRAPLETHSFDPRCNTWILCLAERIGQLRNAEFGMRNCTTEFEGLELAPVIPHSAFYIPHYEDLV
jgi:hypothetical protein